MDKIVLIGCKTGNVYPHYKGYKATYDTIKTYGECTRLVATKSENHIYCEKRYANMQCRYCEYPECL